MNKTLILIFAIFVDICFGEYSRFIHPVVFMGSLGGLSDQFINRKTNSNVIKFLVGMITQILEITVWLFLVHSIFIFIGSLEGYLKIILYVFSVYMLKATFSIRGLYEHVKKCYVDDTDELRRSVSKIVSRDTSKLDKAHLYSAAIESLSENISDSITGPLFYYVLFGLPGALIYRIVNTYDALFGYHNERYEWFGKFCARFDDVLNFIPARLTALFILPFDLKSSYKYVRKYGGIKINATYPMSAFAGVLGVGLEKIGFYKFEGRLPEKEDVKRALRLYLKVVILILIVAVITSFLNQSTMFNDYGWWNIAKGFSWRYR